MPMAQLARCALLIVGLANASSAAAQVLDSRGVPYRQWDFAATVGLHTSRDTADVLNDYNDWTAAWTIEGNVGRYWTSHLKTELAAVYLPQRRDFGSEPVQTPQGTGYAYYEARTSLRQLDASLTYQFFENVFAHPYVAGGARVEWGNVEKTYVSSVTVPGRSPATAPIPPPNTHRRDVETYPFLAAGFKSYFDERAFIRSEMSTTYDRHGVNQFSLRVGFGVDF
jgi:hypothetical protein